jgi:hypothetical protein
MHPQLVGQKRAEWRMTDVPPEQHKKLCTTCGEPIAQSARKCIHCDTYQDWRGYLAFSSTVLALLVALLSVATVAGPVFRDLLISKDSKLVASFQELHNEEATFVVSNSGSQAGTVGEAFVLVAEKGQTTLIPLPRVFKSSVEEREGQFIEAGKSRLVRYEPPREVERISNISWADVTKLQCAIGIHLINFSARREASCFQHSCVSIHNALIRDQGALLAEVPSPDGGSEHLLDRCVRRR